MYTITQLPSGDDILNTPTFLFTDIHPPYSAYSQFDRCLAGFGIRQTCVPRYLSTLDVLVGYSCGQGRNGKWL